MENPDNQDDVTESFREITELIGTLHSTFDTINIELSDFAELIAWRKDALSFVENMCWQYKEILSSEDKFADYPEETKQMIKVVDEALDSSRKMLERFDKIQEALEWNGAKGEPRVKSMLIYIKERDASL